MPTILVVEDDPTIRLTIEFALTKSDFAVTTAADGITGLQVAQQISPDLILLDVMLPKMNGIDVARAIRKEDIETPIIMVTALGGDEDKVAGLDAGADDYITKPFSTQEMLARIRANLRRAKRPAEDESGGILEFGDMTIDTDSAKVEVKGQPLTLRSKEYELLLSLAQRPGALCRRENLSKAVWEEEFLPTSRTIDVHIRRIRKAIETDSDYIYIHTVHGMGYRFEVEPKTGNEE